VKFEIVMFLAVRITAYCDVSPYTLAYTDGRFH